MKYFLALFCLIASLHLYAQERDSAYQVLFARASADLDNGSYKNAVLEFNQLVNSNVADAEVYLKRGVAHFHLNEHQLAAEDFDRAQKEGLRSAELFGYRGLNYYEMDEPDKAGPDLESAANLGFDDPRIYFILGNIKFREERYQQAISHYQEAGKKGFESAVLLNNTGKALYLLDRKEEAVRNYTLAIETDETYLVAFRNRAVANYELEKWEEALNDYTFVLANDPSEAIAYLHRGKAAYQLDRWEIAIEDLKKAEARGAGDDESTAMIAEAYFNQPDYKNASLYFDKAVRKNNADINAWSKLGISLYRQQQFSNAVKAFEKAEEGGADVAGYLGLSLYNTGESEKAYTILSRIAGSDFQEIDAYRILAELQMKKSAYSQAMSTFSRWIELDENNPQAYLGHARSYILLKKDGNIDPDIQKALSLSGSPKTYREAGLIYFLGNQDLKTIEYLTKAENPGMEDSEINIALGLSYFRQGELEKALPGLKAAVIDAGNRDKAMLPLAVCYYHSGDLAAAADWFSKAEAIREIPSNYRYAYAHASFNEKKYPRVLALTDGLAVETAPVEIARMRAVSAFSLKQYSVALNEARKATPDETIRRIGGMSAFNEKLPDDVVTFLAGVADDVETLEALAWAYGEKNNAQSARDIYSTLIELDQANAGYYLHRGILNAGLEDMGAALADYTSALTIDPDLHTARNERGRIAYDLEKYQTAIEDFEILAERNAGPETLYMLGMSYWHTGAADKAMPMLADAYDKGFARADMAAILGTHYFESADYERALDRLNKAVHLGDENSHTLLLRARSQYQLENYEMAIADFERTAEDSFERNLEYGHSLYETGNLEKAREMLQKAVSLNPKNAQACFHLGNTEFRLKSYSQAINTYEKAIANGMKSEILFNNTGKAYFLLENYKEAIPYFTSALEMDDTYSKARLNRGMTYFEMDEYSKAIDDLKLLDGSEFPEVNPLLGDCYFEKSEFPSALKYFNRAVDGGDKSGGLYHKRGRTLMALEQYSTALADLNNALAAGKKDAEVYLDRARVNIYIGNDPAAMKDLNEAIALDPENPVAYYNRGYLRELQENFNEAISDYRKVIALDESDHRAYYSMANSMVSLGQVSAALEPIDKAISLKTDEPSYFKVKGNITYRLERKQEACGLWQKAVDLGDAKSNFYLDQYCR